MLLDVLEDDLVELARIDLEIERLFTPGTRVPRKKRRSPGQTPEWWREYRRKNREKLRAYNRECQRRYRAEAKLRKEANMRRA